MAKVTVCIPTRNRPFFLREALESVMAQTYEDFAVLVSDNASTDDTGTVVVQFERACGGERIIYYRHPRVTVENWRFALTTPKTEFVALLCDDDLWLPDHLKRGMEALEADGGATIYACGTEFFGDRPMATYHPAIGAHAGGVVKRELRCEPDRWLLEFGAVPSSTICRRSALDDVRWPRKGLPAGDRFLFCQVALKGRFIYDPAVGIRYRWHSGNDSVASLDGFRKRRRWSAQLRYVQRLLAGVAMSSCCIDPHAFEEGLVRNGCAADLAQLVLALSARDAPLSARVLAQKVVARRPDVLAAPSISGHCRVARKVGLWYLSWADTVDRVLGGWRPRECV